MLIKNSRLIERHVSITVDVAEHEVGQNESPNYVGVVGPVGDDILLRGRWQLTRKL